MSSYTGCVCIRYLRASILASCHDACKFLNPISETKPMPPTRPKLAEIELPTRRRHVSPQRPPGGDSKLKQPPWKNGGSSASAQKSGKQLNIVTRSGVVKDGGRVSEANGSGAQQKVSRLEIKNGDSAGMRSKPCNCIRGKTASRDEKMIDDSVPEKIIHVVDPIKVSQTAEQKIRWAGSGREEKDSPPRKLGEPQNGNARPMRRVFNNAESTHPKGSAIRADLRRLQVVQTSRNSGLMNTVIEETASKLVHERKSKVKALVGAFESVIKNQEPERTTTSTAS